MKLKRSWKAASIGAGIESCALVLLLLDDGSPKEGFSLGGVGLFLHLPGWWAMRLTNASGNAAWLILVGVSLLFWVGLVELFFLAARAVQKIGTS